MQVINASIIMRQCFRGKPQRRNPYLTLMTSRCQFPCLARSRQTRLDSTKFTILFQVERNCGRGWGRIFLRGSQWHFCASRLARCLSKSSFRHHSFWQWQWIIQVCSTFFTRIYAILNFGDFFFRSLIHTLGESFDGCGLISSIVNVARGNRQPLDLYLAETKAEDGIVQQNVGSLQICKRFMI